MVVANYGVAADAQYVTQHHALDRRPQMVDAQWLSNIWRCIVDDRHFAYRSRLGAQAVLSHVGGTVSNSCPGPGHINMTDNYLRALDLVWRQRCSHSFGNNNWFLASLASGSKECVGRVTTCSSTVASRGMHDVRPVDTGRSGGLLAYRRLKTRGQLDRHTASQPLLLDGNFRDNTRTINLTHM